MVNCAHGSQCAHWDGFGSHTAVCQNDYLYATFNSGRRVSANSIQFLEKSLFTAASREGDIDGIGFPTTEI